MRYHIAIAKDSEGNLSLLAHGADADPVHRAYKQYAGGKAYFGHFAQEKAKNVLVDEPPAAPRKAAKKKSSD